MKVKNMFLLAGASSLLMAGVASADFTGLEVELHGSYNGHDVYRLYADFDGGPGIIGFWGGDGGENAFTITNDVAVEGDAAGSGFYQPAAAGGPMVQPNDFLYGLFTEEFNNSTYMTIGVGAGWNPGDVGEVFQLAPGFSPTVNGQVSWGGLGGIVTNPGGPNSIADGGRVLLGQFTVLAGEHVTGTNITISGQHLAAGAGDLENFQVSGLSFTTIPAPGALALLGLAGLAGARRRRA